MVHVGVTQNEGAPPFPGNATLLVENHLGGGTTHMYIYIYIAILYLHAIMRHRNQPSIDTYTVDTMGNQW